MSDKKQVGIWVRVSTEFQVKDDSPEHHERRARMYIESKDWEVAEVYRLEAVSGKAVIDLPEAKRMLADIRSKKISGLVFSKLARLARNTKELLEFAEIFRANNADLISLSESIDTSTPAGRLFYTMIAAMAEWERAEIAERVAASVPVRAKMGKSLGGITSYGYKWENNALIIEEKEKPVRKLMYELFIEMRRKKHVADELNRRGYRTRNGSPWTDTTIERLLRDPTAKGVRRANYTKSRGGGKGWDVKPIEDWVLIDCPAVVSAELWNQVNAILDEQAKPRGRRGKLSRFLLSGFVYCSCGKKMYVLGPSYSCRDCRRKILVDDIDEIYQSQLKGYLTETTATELRSQSETAIAEKEELLKQANQEHAALFKKAKETLDLHLAGDLAKPIFQSLYKPIEERLLQVEDYLPELEAEIDFLKINLASSETILDEAKTLYDQWQTTSFEQKRGIIEIITDSVVIEDQDITISFATVKPHSSFYQNDMNYQHNRTDSYC